MIAVRATVRALCAIASLTLGGCGGFNFGNSFVQEDAVGSGKEVTSETISVSFDTGTNLGTGGSSSGGADPMLGSPLSAALLAFNPLKVSFCNGVGDFDASPLALDLLVGRTSPAEPRLAAVTGGDICVVHFRLTALPEAPPFDPDGRLLRNGIFARIAATAVDAPGAYASGGKEVEVALDMDFSVAPSSPIRPDGSGSLQIGIDTSIWFQNVHLSSAEVRSGTVYANDATNPTVAAAIRQNIARSVTVSWRAER